MVVEDDSDGFEALVEAMEELGGEVSLGDGMVDVGEGVGEEFHATGIFRDGEFTLFEVTILPV